MKYILIARVSDIEQQKALPAQKLRLEQYVKNLKEPYEYHEFNESAYKDARQKFGELVEYISKSTELVAVVFDKIDRFTRDASQKEVRIMSNLVQTGKIEMHFPSDNLFITERSPATDLFRLGIGMLLAKYYSDSSRDNVKRRFEQMVNDGVFPGAAPIGYMNINRGTKDRPQKDIVIDTLRSAHIVKMFEMRALGIPYSQIAKYVTEQGLTSKSGKVVNKSAAEKILKNPFYYGQMLYKGKIYDHKYEPLIDRRLFNQCQDVRQQRHDVHTPYNSLAYTFMKIVKCKVCGCTISSFKSKGNVYLKCTQSKGKCTNKNTAEKLLLPEITNLMSTISVPTEHLPKVIRELKQRHDTQSAYYMDSITSTRSEYEKVTARLKSLAYERIEGRITVDLYNEIVTELEQSKQTLNDRLNSLTSSNKNFEVTVSYLLDLAQKSAILFENSSEALKQKLLKFLLSNLELGDKKLSFVVNDPYKNFIEANKKAQIAPESLNWCG